MTGHSWRGVFCIYTAEPLPDVLRPGGSKTQEAQAGTRQLKVNTSVFTKTWKTEDLANPETV